jgi:hypothetical protein
MTLQKHHRLGLRLSIPDSRDSFLEHLDLLPELQQSVLELGTELSASHYSWAESYWVILAQRSQDGIPRNIASRSVKEERVC